MILLTGATGLIGTALLNRLIERRHTVRCLVRDPRRLGPNRVRVQITLGDLADSNAVRQAVRGAETIVHLGATIRDQPAGSIEEIDGLATARLLRAAERAGARRFVFFSALGATPSSPARFFRAKALAAEAVLASHLDARVFAPSIVYAPGDPFLRLIERLSLLPWMPIAGAGQAAFQPIWVDDVSACCLSLLDGADPGGRRVLELVGPETLTYDEIVRLVLTARRRTRPLLHVPMPIVQAGLDLIGRFAGSSVFAAAEEAELMEISMTTDRGDADVRALGVEPRSMRQVLGLAE